MKCLRRCSTITTRERHGANTLTITAPPGGFANPWQGYPEEIRTRSSRARISFPIGGYYETVPLDVRNTYVEQWNSRFRSSWEQLAAEGQLPGQQHHPPVDRSGTESGGLCPRQLCRWTVWANQAWTLFHNVQHPGAPTVYAIESRARAVLRTVEYLDDGGTASYNALIVSAEHRFSNHFSMLANYTYSHCIGDLVTWELSGPIYTYPADRRFDRGNCTAVDVRGNFNLSAVLQSPHYFRGRCNGLLETGSWHRL